MATIHAFGPFRLDADAEILFRGSDPLPVGKRAVAVLRVLVERAGAPVSKDTLIGCGVGRLGGRGEQSHSANCRTASGTRRGAGGADWIVTNSEAVAHLE